MASLQHIHRLKMDSIRLSVRWSMLAAKPAISFMTIPPLHTMMVRYRQAAQCAALAFVATK